MDARRFCISLFERRLRTCALASAVSKTRLTIKILIRTGDRAAITSERRPYPGEGEQGSLVIEREPRHVFPF